MSKKSIEALVQVVRETLSEFALSGKKYAFSSWDEADGDAGYMISIAGKMMGIGDYQHGFDSLDDLAKAGASSDQEQSKLARREIGRIAAELSDENEFFEDPERQEYVKSMAAFNFAASAPVVSERIDQGMTLPELFELYHSRPANTYFVFDGSVPHYNVENGVLAKDLTVSFLSPQCQWVSNTLFRAGDVLPTVPRAQGRSVYVPGGEISMSDEDFTSFTPAAAPSCSPRRSP